MTTQRAQTTWQRGTTFRGALRVDQVAEGFTVDENTNVTFVGKCVDDPNVDLDFVNALNPQKLSKSSKPYQPNP